MNKKQPSKVVKFQPRPAREDESELMNFLCMVCSSMGLFMRNTLFLWAGLFILLSLFCRKRNNTGYSQYMMTVMMIIFGMTTSYYYKVPMKA